MMILLFLPMSSSSSPSNQVNANDQKKWMCIYMHTCVETAFICSAPDSLKENSLSSCCFRRLY